MPERIPGLHRCRWCHAPCKPYELANHEQACRTIDLELLATTRR